MSHGRSSAGRFPRLKLSLSFLWSLDRGAAVVLASDRLQDLAGLCDAYLFLVGGQGTLFTAQEITTVGPVTGALLTDIFDKLRGGPPSLRIAS